jgi:F-type H+-transporting ATPase subunit delta
LRDHNEYDTYPLLFGRDNCPEAPFYGHFSVEKDKKPPRRTQRQTLRERSSVAAQSTGQSGLAKRYAAAFFDLALEQDQLDQLAGELDDLRALMAESADLARLVRSPIFSRADQGAAMAAIIARAGMSKLVANFVGLMAKNRRLFALEGAIAAFHVLLAEHRGEVSAEVTSAAELKPAHLSAVKEALKKIVGRDVVLETKIDPSLIGGLIVKVGSRMIDNSIRTKLQNLELAMKGI